jgi:demethylmenaquinone methyltransferase/2-methoxy-6-polyprenyl-1,4-benzoquinol methylase
MHLRDRIARPDRKRRYVRSLFATIADRYDLITRVLSYGQDRRWKRRLLDLARPGPSVLVLDLATGTGDLAWGAAAQSARVVGLDVTTRMIQLAAGKSESSRRPLFLVGDMEALPFASRRFDIVTVGYGLRNVPNLVTAIDEIARVLKTDGAALSLDFNRPENPVLRWCYLRYLEIVGGALGWMLHRDPDTYRYIPASIRTYPGADGVSRLLRERGFSSVRHYPVLGGLLSIHHAVGPKETPRIEADRG